MAQDYSAQTLKNSSRAISKLTIKRLSPEPHQNKLFTLWRKQRKHHTISIQLKPSKNF